MSKEQGSDIDAFRRIFFIGRFWHLAFSGLEGAAGF